MKLFIDTNLFIYLPTKTLKDERRIFEFLVNYNLRPSDALHAAVIENNGLQAIVSEDENFDVFPLKILWLGD